MKRLITFGCSHTYGHGLDDCLLPNYMPGPLPSKYAWPSILRNLLNIKVINLSRPGSSNKMIWKTILDTSLNEDDIVIILWTYRDRWCVFNDTNDNVYEQDIGPWIKNKLSKIYYKNFYSILDTKIDFYNRTNFIHYYLNSKNIKNYHLVYESTKDFPKWNNVKFEFDLINYELWPKAKDNNHLGISAHEDIAKRIHKILKK